MQGFQQPITERNPSTFTIIRVSEQQLSCMVAFSGTLLLCEQHLMTSICAVNHVWALLGFFLMKPQFHLIFSWYIRSVCIIYSVGHSSDTRKRLVEFMAAYFVGWLFVICFDYEQGTHKAQRTCKHYILSVNHLQVGVTAEQYVPRKILMITFV